MPYEELSHTADLRIRIYAKDIETLFSEAISALYYTIFGREHLTCKGKENDSFSIKGEDLDILLHDLLDEVLYLTIVLKRKICEFKLKINNKSEENVIFFEYKYESLDYKEVKKEVKAITYHNLHITKKGNLYETEVVMDV